jgi:hypothetical protein
LDRGAESLIPALPASLMPAVGAGAANVVLGVVGPLPSKTVFPLSVGVATVPGAVCALEGWLRAIIAQIKTAAAKDLRNMVHL